RREESRQGEEGAGAQGTQEDRAGAPRGAEGAGAQGRRAQGGTDGEAPRRPQASGQAPLRLALLLLGAGLLACPAPALPFCRTAAELQHGDGADVVVVGRYTRLAVPVGKKLPPEHLGHAAVDVDGVLVRIGKTPRALEELVRFDGKSVAVTGRLLMRPPLEQ